MRCTSERGRTDCSLSALIRCSNRDREKYRSRARCDCKRLAHKTSTKITKEKNQMNPKRTLFAFTGAAILAALIITFGAHKSHAANIKSGTLLRLAAANV